MLGGMITALRATSRTIAAYLQAQFELDTALSSFFKAPGTMRTYLNTPADMHGSRAGLSIWLYRVVRDDSTLNRPPERITPTLTRPAPLPVRLHYLMTPMTNVEQNDAQETELVILGKVLQCFHQRPRLVGTDLRDDFEGTDTLVTLRLEVLPLDELARTWDALNVPYRASVSYEATFVDIEAGVEPDAAAPVRVPLQETGVIVGAEA
jgi:Pvc16 N-terminal domain